MYFRTLGKLAIVFGLVLHVHAQTEVFLIGTTLKLSCNVPESFSKVKWEKSATVLAEVEKGRPQVAPSDPRASVDTIKNFGELSIQDIQFHDAGNYSCTVEFSDQLPKTTLYQVKVVESTIKPPITTTSTRAASSSTVSTDSDNKRTTENRTNGGDRMTPSFQINLYACIYMWIVAIQMLLA